MNYLWISGEVMSRLLTTAGGEEQEGGVAEVGGDGPMRDALTTQVGTNGSLSYMIIHVNLEW